MAESEIWNIELTVPTGFESAASSEILEKFGEVTENDQQGHVFFKLNSLDDAEKLPQLRTCDHIFVVIYREKKFDFRETKAESSSDVSEPADDVHMASGEGANDEQNGDPPPAKKPHVAFKRIASLCHSLVDKCNFVNGLRLWQKLRQTDYDIDSILSGGALKDGASQTLPTFRVTCRRSGGGHQFSSMDAAASFGGGINDRFKWPVKMKDFDVEVVLNIAEGEVYVGIALTSESMHRRNIETFGATTLRATICHGLLRFAKIEPGAVVCDAMCGVGSIPIEGAISFPNSYFLAADSSDIAMHRCASNVNRMSSTHNIDVVRWNSCRMPVRDECFDAIVTDLPFGKRMGSTADNRKLYPAFLKECCRVLKPHGHIVLLTGHQKCLLHSIKSAGCDQLRTVSQKTGNIGGIKALVCVLAKHVKKA